MTMGERINDAVLDAVEQHFGLHAFDSTFMGAPTFREREEYRRASAAGLAGRILGAFLKRGLEVREAA